MRKFFTALRAGVRAATDNFGPGPFAVAGRQVSCGHCGAVDFTLRSAVSRVAMGAPISAYGLVCHACSHIELFAAAPQRI